MERTCVVRGIPYFFDMTRGSHAKKSQKRASKRHKATETRKTPTADEIDNANTKQLRQWSKSLGLDGAHSKTSAEGLRELIRNYLAEDDDGLQDHGVEVREKHPSTAVCDGSSEISFHELPESSAAKPQAPIRRSDLGKHACEVLYGLSKDMERIASTYPDSFLLFEKARAKLDGFIGGLCLALETQDVTASYGQPEPPEQSAPEQKSWAAIVKARPTQTTWTKTPASEIRSKVEADRQRKSTALQKLRELNPLSFERSRQGIWEPQMNGFRKMEIPVMVFKREVDQALEELYGEENAVQFCKRLERGGFRLQLSERIWKHLSKTKDMLISTASKGTWVKVDSFDPTTNFSIVAEGIEHGITGQMLVEEIAVHNASCHGKNPDEARDSILKAERLQRKDHESGKLVPTRNFRIFGNKEFLDLLLERQGFFVGGAPVYAREFEAPRYRCMQCGQLGHHKMEHCRNKPVCRNCRGEHLTWECPKSKAKVGASGLTEEPNDLRGQGLSFRMRKTSKQNAQVQQQTRLPKNRPDEWADDVPSNASQRGDDRPSTGSFEIEPDLEKAIKTVVEDYRRSATSSTYPKSQ